MKKLSDKLYCVVENFLDPAEIKLLTNYTKLYQEYQC